MRQKIVKLVAAVAVLAAGLGVGVAPKPASALSNCPAYYCCDPSCFGIRPCRATSQGCICTQACQPNLPGGGL
jgi:hypothetical protein